MKKFNKKLLTSLAFAAMAVGLAGCCAKVGDESQSSSITKPIDNAAYFINQLYKDDDGKTLTDDVERVTTYIDSIGRKYEIMYYLDYVTKGVPDGYVTLRDGRAHPAEGEDESGYLTIDIDTSENCKMDVEFTVKGVITNGKEIRELNPINYKMNKFRVWTWDEYVATCKESGSKAGDAKNKALNVEGIVTAIISQSNGNSSNCLYVQDDDKNGAFYAYGLSTDPVTDGIKVGNRVRIGGETGLYSSQYEVLGPSAKLLDDTVKSVSPVDYTAKFVAAPTVKDASICGAQGLYVEIKDVVIAGVDSGRSGYNFTKNGKTSFVRISSSVCPISKTAQTKMIADHASHFGWTADVKGIIMTYDGDFYLTPIEDNPFTFKSLPEKSDADAVAFEKENLTIETSIDSSKEVELPTKGPSYSTVNIAWAIKAGTTSKTCVLANDKATFTLGEEAETVTLVATISRNAATATKEFEIAVDALTGEEFVPEIYDDIRWGTYKFVMDCADYSAPLYAVASLNTKGALETTDKPEKGADFLIAGNENDGFTIKVGDKYLEGYKNGNYNNLRFVDTCTNKWFWSNEAKVFTTIIDETTCYCGSYLKNNAVGNTISLSAITYITGTNASKVGVSQFVARPAALRNIDYLPKQVNAAKTGSFKVFMDCGEGEERLYAVASLNTKGALETDTRLNKAANFVVDGNDTDGYTIKVGDLFLEGYKNGNYNNLRFAETCSNKWAWNDTLKVFTTKINDKEFYFGTYLRNDNTYTKTFALSETKYVTGDNASKVGVSQFVGHFLELVPGIVNREVLTEPAEGTYKIMMGVNVYGVPMYATGTLNTKGALETDTRMSKAVDVVIAGNATDGYTFKIGDKYLEGFKSGNYNNLRLADTSSNKWSWDAELKVFKTTIETKVCYLGAYLRSDNTVANTISLSETKYISGTNASKIGVSQFPAQFCKFVIADDSEPAGEKEISDPFKVSKTIASLKEENNFQDAAIISSFNFDGAIAVTVGCKDGAQDSTKAKYYANGQNLRLYQSGECSITFNSGELFMIKSVKITYNYKNTGTLLNGTGVIASGDVVTVNAHEITLKSGNTSTATNGQVQITAIEIVYVAVEVNK